MNEHYWDDKRAPEHHETHTVAVAAVDRFMSGWGAADGATRIAVWVCKPEHSDAVRAWVKGRDEMLNVKETGTDHLTHDSVKRIVEVNGRAVITVHPVFDSHPCLKEEQNA